MHMLYNSDSFTVVMFEIPGAPGAQESDAPRGGFEIVDKFARGRTSSSKARSPSASRPASRR